MNNDQGISTAAIAAICSGLTALVTALFVRGGPAIAAWWNRSDALEQMRSKQAKEGPLMVIARLELELSSLTAKYDNLGGKYDKMQAAHAECDRKYAAMEERLNSRDREIVELKSDIDEMRKAQAKETQLRVTGDAKNAGHNG